MKKLIFTIFILSTAFAQTTFKGQLLDPQGKPLFAANILLKSDPQKGSLTDFEGQFIWKGSLEDSLLIKYPGLMDKVVALRDYPNKEEIVVKMKEKSLSLQEVSIRARRPISDQFSVVKLKKLDIYLNPVSAADPLRAITVLPSSTNTQESANPSLRGSAANRSRVILNGIPIYSPVRNSQINGLGNFSLFNTEMVESQYVYASNPPLTYGNSSGGLVQIETKQKIPQNSTQLSLSLANLGFFRDQKLGEKAFLQAYGNFQFSDAFIGIQPEVLGFLKAFSTKDLGLHLHLPIGSKWNMKLFSYGIRESYRVETQVYAHRDEAFGGKDRTFHLLRLSKQGNNSITNIHAGLDLSNSSYAFGNIRSRTQTQQTYFSAEYKAFVGRKFSWQVGANYDGYGRSFQDTSSILFYSAAPHIPGKAIDTVVSRPLLEGHLYARWEAFDQLSFSAAIRSNAPIARQSNFLSFQASARWDVNTEHSFLLSGGRYHSYMVPNFFFRGNELLQVDQLALDYTFSREMTRLTAAVFLKDERGIQNDNFLFIDRAQVAGLEASFKQNLGKYLQFSLANTYLIHQIRFSPESPFFNGSQDLPFFIKSSLSYNHPKFFNLNIVWLGRPGTYFTPIESSQYRPEWDIYEPLWGELVNTERLPAYHNVSLGLSRYQLLKNGSLVLFLSVNNIFNRLNPSDAWYNRDFSSFSYAPFSLRTIYFGGVWQFLDKKK